MKYLIYARVSPKGSTWSSQETSIPMQIDLCRQYVESRGNIVADIVADEFYTASNWKRPGMQRVMAELDAGAAEWDAIITYRLDRLIRSVGKGAPLIERLQARGKGFATVKENIDLATPFGRCYLHILLALAQLEREQTAERTRDKMVSIAESGCWAPGRTPVGYTRRGKSDNVLVIVPEEAEVVRAIYRKYLDGVSTTKLRDQYYPHHTSVQTVVRILRNPVYLGKIQYKAHVYDGQHAAIIDQATYDAVQKRLPNQRGKSTRPNAWKRENLLTGLLFCSCGNPMTTKYTRKSKKHPYYYYTCTDRRTCSQKPVRAEQLEEIVIDAIKAAPLDRATIDQHIQKIHEVAEQKAKDLAPQLHQVTQAIRETAKQVSNLESMFAQGLVTKANSHRINAKMASLSTQLEDQRLRQRELKAAQAPKLGPYKSAAHLLNQLQTLNQALQLDPPPSVQRAIITANVRRIDRDQSDPAGFKIHLNFTSNDSCANSRWGGQMRELAQLVLSARLTVVSK